MRRVARSMIMVVLALLAAVVIGITSTFTAAVTLTATTALIMGGTGRPDPGADPLYMQNVESYYVNPFTQCTPAATCNEIAVITPEEFFPLPMYGGLTALTFDESVRQGVIRLGEDYSTQRAADPTGSIVIVGYSQSAHIASIFKRDLAEDPSAPPGEQLEFVLFGNPDRGNGGILARAPGFYLPFLDVTFGPSTPIDSPYATTDVAFRYDVIADAPLYPLNGLTLLNAILGFQYLHGTMPDPTAGNPGAPGGYTQTEWQAMMDDPGAYPDIIQVTTDGDTTYLTVVPKELPLFAPLIELSGATGTAILVDPLLDLLRPVVTVLIETGYDRTIPYGQQTPFRFFPVINPLPLLNLPAAIVQGVAAAIGGLGAIPLAPLSVPAPATTPPPTVPATSSAAETQSSRPAPSVVPEVAEPATTDNSESKQAPTETGSTDAQKVTTTPTETGTPPATKPDGPETTGEIVRNSPDFTPGREDTTTDGSSATTEGSGTDGQQSADEESGDPSSTDAEDSAGDSTGSSDGADGSASNAA